MIRVFSIVIHIPLMYRQGKGAASISLIPKHGLGKRYRDMSFSDGRRLRYGFGTWNRRGITSMPIPKFIGRFKPYSLVVFGYSNTRVQ